MSEIRSNILDIQESSVPQDSLGDALRCLEYIKYRANNSDASEQELESLYNSYQRYTRIKTRKFLDILLNSTQGCVIPEGALDQGEQVIISDTSEINGDGNPVPVGPENPEVTEELLPEEVEIEPIPEPGQEDGAFLEDSNIEEEILPEDPTQEGVEGTEIEEEPVDGGLEEELDISTAQKIQAIVVFPEGKIEAELQQKFTSLFAEKYLASITGKEEAFFQNERIKHSNKFLKGVLELTVQELSLSEREAISDSYFEVPAFISYTRNKKLYVRNKDLRIYLKPYINPQEKNTETSLQDALKDGKEIPDPKLRELIFSIIGESFLEKDLIQTISPEQKETILKNFEAFLRFTMRTESNFKNAVNDVSSAKARLQFLSGEVNGIVDISLYNNNGLSSLQVGINRTLNTLNSLGTSSLINEYTRFFQSAQTQANTSYLYNSTQFTGGQETILLLGDLVGKSKIENRGYGSDLKYLMSQVLLFGNPKAAQEIYARYHHTDKTHSATSSLVERNMNIDKKYFSAGDDTLKEIGVQREIESLLGSTDLISSTKGQNLLERIRVLQKLLGILGFPVDTVTLGSEIRSFGPATQRALEAFQSHYSLDVDGVFGLGAREKMKDLIDIKLKAIYAGTDPYFTKQDILDIFSGKKVDKNWSLVPQSKPTEQEILTTTESTKSKIDNFFTQSISVNSKGQMVIIQRMLIKLGHAPKKSDGTKYSIEEVNGTYGNATRGAIAQYLEKESFPTQPTVEQLKEFLEKLKIDISKLQQRDIDVIFTQVNTQSSKIQEWNIDFEKRVDIGLPSRVDNVVFGDHISGNEFKISGSPLLREGSPGFFKNIDEVIYFYENNKSELESFFIATDRYSKGYNTSLGVKRRINNDTASQSKASKYYNANYSTRVFPALFQLWKQGKLPDISRTSEKQVQGINDRLLRKGQPVGEKAINLLEEGKLVALPLTSNPLWQIQRPEYSNSRTIFQKIREGRTDLGYLHPAAKETLEHISKRFQEKLYSSGFNKDLGVRLVLNSILRTYEYNKYEVGSLEESAHIFGIGFDINHNFFEVYKIGDIDNFVAITNRAKGGEVNIGLTARFKAILYETLQELDNSGDIILTKEGSHPHITVIDL